MSDIIRLKGLPIGIDNYKKLIDRGCLFIDKSLFIKEIIDDAAEVKLITRPRRFGKTLNLSMLRYFFEKTEEDNSRLFKDLNIWKQGEFYTKEQGQYPVINLTFKDVKYRNFSDCFERINILIADEYKRHNYILQSANLEESDKKIYVSIMNEEASYVRISAALEFLTSILRQYHKREVIVLIDEYDTPINLGYTYGYYDDITDFTKNFLGSGLKGNPNLKTSIITGIYRVAKESIFSGFNNIKVCSVIHDSYADKFGFTEDEVRSILEYYGIGISIDVVKDWYNGYIFGDGNIIYNPWSLLNYTEQKKLQPYWVNTSSNDIIRDVLNKTGSGVKEKLHVLMEGSALEDQVIDTDTNFRDIIGKEIIGEDVLWSLLLISGYLKPENTRVIEGRNRCELKIPNKEIFLLFENIVLNWFEVGEMAPNTIKDLLTKLTEGNIERFSVVFKHLVQGTFSYFDVGINAAENFYHAFILGILVNLEGKYRVRSNRESGKGRPDIMIIPNDTAKKGVIIEFKISKSGDAKAMEDTAQKALEQIKDSKYMDELISCGIKEAVELAIVFSGKNVHMEYVMRNL